MTLPQQLDHAWIAARIPHTGAMCLLDRVVSWSADAICCEATSHALPDNPLREDGRLATLCGIEYAAQAMAVHGAILACVARHDGSGPNQDAATPTRPRAGYLASIRKVAQHAERLDTWSAPLRIEATRISGDSQVVIYTFALHGGMGAVPRDASDPARRRCLLSGRATVMLDAPT